ncbi:MAG: hypothetical protein H6R22_24 [Chromatiaceae bacterium]|jgi:uncharacterized protein (DUF2249 family)|nr:hypothetical protein [Chromatiaceae bacterium]
MDLLLDVSGLPPPEPLERTLDALGGLAPGDRLLVRLGRQPYPLYDLLRRMGYRWEVTGEDGDWRILVEPESEPESGPEPEHRSGSPARS